MDEVRKVVLTYGTFDLFHVGHLNLLERLADLGGKLIVGVSTDEFNELKGKRTVVDYQDRARIVAGLKCVDAVIPEEGWEQKRADIVRYDVDIFGMGHDWEGKFDELRDLCEVVYLPRTDGVSSTQIKELLRVLDKSHVDDLKKALDLIQSIVQKFE
ncbi:Glycerol-3-phosphate cytidylyltransferase [Kushneria avicenniae]|uniref:Glycerol-3-phosphate cytidylyltransferase n=1 Tax=Kushneria avicenniae TaxID=402385 RepID=A0A1I1I913_9GAMM|nr:adenylyltransferase/cytidyltransferase family protein [Kushneria avicenniae]SFC32654.1 Glycerol-3-phosphate cytidylyltransferase [Kushneria avicenniae]